MKVLCLYVIGLLPELEALHNEFPSCAVFFLPVCVERNKETLPQDPSAWCLLPSAKVVSLSLQCLLPQAQADVLRRFFAAANHAYSFKL